MLKRFFLFGIALLASSLWLVFSDPNGKAMPPSPLIVSASGQRLNTLFEGQKPNQRLSLIGFQRQVSPICLGQASTPPLLTSIRSAKRSLPGACSGSYAVCDWRDCGGCAVAFCYSDAQNGSYCTGWTSGIWGGDCQCYTDDLCANEWCIFE